MNELAFTYLFMNELNVKVCGIMKGLLRMYGVMGIYMFISLVDQDWSHEQDVIMIYMQTNKYMCYLMQFTVMFLRT